MKKQNDIEAIFQEAFEKFEGDPGANAWANIQSQMNTGTGASQIVGKASSMGGSSSLMTAIVAVVVSAGLIGGYFYFSEDEQPTKAKEVKLNDKASIDPKINKNTTSIQLENEDAKVERSNTEEIVSNENSKVEAENKVEKTTNVVAASNPQSLDSEINKPEESSPIESVSEAKSTANKSSQDISKIEEKASPVVSESSAQDSQTASDGQHPQSIADETSQEGNVNTDSDLTSSAVNDNAQHEDSPEEKIIRARLVEILDNVSKYLTPNQDRQGDIFRVEIDNPEDVDRISVQISNIGGKEVHKWQEIYGYWDGIMPDGSIAENGNYPYVIILEKGNVREIKRALLYLRK